MIDIAQGLFVIVAPFVIALLIVRRNEGEQAR